MKKAKKDHRVKRIIFYITAVVAPFVIWLSLEWLANTITHRFDPLKVDKNKGTLYLNQDYFTDFFLYDLDRYVNTSISNRAVHKEKNYRFRIFSLGGSTTAGYPYNTLPEYNCPASFANYLRAILQYNKNLPEIEMLNLGSNAFNSLSVLKVFEDVKKYDPDLIIIYTGHNEYFGPNEFALSKSANEIYAKKFFNHGFLKLRQTYLYQGLKWILKKIFKRGEAEYQDYASWSMQNTIPFGDEYHSKVKVNFKRNLTELVRMAKKEGVQVVVCTPVSNLTFPPFVSQFKEELVYGDKARWDSVRTQASRLYEAHNYDAALSKWKEMYEIDSTYADVHYYAGMNYARLNEYQIANEALSRAVDLDALPFRTKYDIQNITREVAKNENVILADVDQFYRQLSGKYYPEPSMLLDHVHPTEPGYYYVAAFLARTLISNNVFPGITDIEYPTLEQTREVLGVYDFVAYKIEFDFTNQSYLKQLSELNPAIEIMINQIRENAITRAKEIGSKFMEEIEKEEKK